MNEGCIPMKEVEHLGKQTTDIDGVGRCERSLGPEIIVHEGLLDNTLAIVKRPYHLYRVYIGICNGKLRPLKRGQSTLRKGT